MFVSLTGLLLRLKGNSLQRFGVDEFIRHYKMAKKAHVNGDTSTVDEFFKIYVTDED